MKQQEAVQRVVQLEDALDRLEVERSELSQKLKAMAHVRGGSGGGHGDMSGATKAEDSGSEVCNEFGASRTACPGPRGRAAPLLCTLSGSYVQSCLNTQPRVHCANTATPCCTIWLAASTPQVP